MEGFTYVDIFATKGIEYILVIGFLLIFVLYWRFLTTPAKGLAEIPVREAFIPSLNEWFNIPENLYYHQGHTWAVPEDDKVIKIGIDDFASKLLGNLNSVKPMALGSKIGQGEPALIVIIDGKQIPVLSPLSGEVIAINDDAIRNPEILNKDPYKDGWLLKLKTDRAGSEVKNLLTGRVAKAWIDSTVERLREISGGDIGLVYQDGGFPVNGIAKTLSSDKWEEIAKEFLFV